MIQRKLGAYLGMLMLVAAGCGPAATATPTAAPRTEATPTRSLTPTATSTVSQPSAPPATPTPPPTTPVAAPKYGGTFRFASKAPVPGWNSLGITGAGLNNVVGYIYDRAMRYNPGPPACQFLPRVPSAVESWKWVNDTTFEMKLRQGMRFHNKPPVNGREATAQDLIFSLVQAGAKPGPGLADVPGAVDKAEAVDRYTARLYLKAPYAVLPDRLSQDAAYFYASEAVGEDMAIVRPEQLIGTGPFMYKGDRAGVSVTLDKNPDYWERGVPYVDNIEFKIVPDVATRAAMFRTGRVDVSWREAVPVTEALVKLPDVTVQRCNDLPAANLGLTPNYPPFNDVRVRRAVSMAIDREAVLKAVYRGNGDLAWAPMPHPAEAGYMQKADYPPEVRQHLEYNPTEARKLLAEAGYPQGVTTQLNFQSRGNVPVELAEALNDQLAKVGIDAKLVGWLDPAWTPTRDAEQIQGMILTLTIAFPGTFQFIRAYHSTRGEGRKRHGIRDPLLDELSEKLTRTRDPEEVKALYRRLQIQFADQAYEPAIFYDRPALIMHPWVKNVYFQPLSALQTVDTFWRVQIAK